VGQAAAAAASDAPEGAAKAAVAAEAAAAANDSPAVLSADGAGDLPASPQTTAEEAAGRGPGVAQEAAPSAGLALHSTPMTVAATADPIAAQVTVAHVAPAGRPADSARSQTEVPGLVFQFGNGAFINTAAPANSPQQFVADRVFRSLAGERADAASPKPPVSLLADALARSLAAEVARAAPDLFDSLFAPAGAADLDWLEQLTCPLDLTGRRDGEATDEAVGVAAGADQDAAAQSLAEGGDSGEGAAGGGE
jgi:hypothetical protein